jgi:hypothetical protein
MAPTIPTGSAPLTAPLTGHVADSTPTQPTQLAPQAELTGTGDPDGRQLPPERPGSHVLDENRLFISIPGNCLHLTLTRQLQKGAAFYT